MSPIAHFEPIDWDASMATGIEAIDKQHQYFLDIIKVANEKLVDNDDDYLLRELAKDLLGYAITHFETEEGLMQRYGYAAACPEEAKAHIAQHRYFSHQVIAVRDQLREGQTVSRTEVLRFLNRWLHEHLLGTDQLLGEYLSQQSRPDTPN